MTLSSFERKIRARLPLIRFLQAYLPLPIARWLIKQGLARVRLRAGEDEILRDDAVRIEALAKAAGVDVRLEIYPRMWHVWQLYLSLPQAVQSLDDIAQFTKSRLGFGAQ